MTQSHGQKESFGSGWGAAMADPVAHQAIHTLISDEASAIAMWSLALRTSVRAASNPSVPKRAMEAMRQTLLPTVELTAEVVEQFLIDALSQEGEKSLGVGYVGRNHPVLFAKIQSIFSARRIEPRRKVRRL